MWGEDHGFEVSLHTMLNGAPSHVVMKSKGRDILEIDFYKNGDQLYRASHFGETGNWKTLAKMKIDNPQYFEILEKGANEAL
jgi:hypothetical protein